MSNDAKNGRPQEEAMEEEEEVLGSEINFDSGKTAREDNRPATTQMLSDARSGAGYLPAAAMSGTYCNDGDEEAGKPCYKTSMEGEEEGSTEDENKPDEPCLHQEPDLPQAAGMRPGAVAVRGPGYHGDSDEDSASDGGDHRIRGGAMAGDEAPPLPLEGFTFDHEPSEEEIRRTILGLPEPTGPCLPESGCPFLCEDAGIEHS
jgi:hypothetical protein